jgi:NhaA family Na+:H+ antiporter
LNWLDIFGVSLIAGIGFTVALLIAQLSFALGTAQATDAKIAIFAGSLCAALLAATVLGRRARAYRVLALTEDIDRNGDGIGDVYQDGVDSAGVQDA